MAQDSTFYPEQSDSSRASDSKAPEWFRLAVGREPTIPHPGAFASTATMDLGDKAATSVEAHRSAMRLITALIVVTVYAAVGATAGPRALAAALAAGAIVMLAVVAVAAVRRHRD